MSDKKINFLKETLSSLKSFGLKESDIISVGNDKYRISWECFEHNADFEYDHGFGGQEICCDLKIYGKNWIMYRNEYDGSEWWEIMRLPKEISPNFDSDKIEFRECNIKFSFFDEAKESESFSNNIENKTLPFGEDEF